MLRYFILLLVVANIALWGWAHGWFGISPGMQGREPSRLQAQIHPELIQKASPLAQETPTDTVDNIVSLPPKIDEPQTQEPTFCIESGPLNANQAQQIQQHIAQILIEPSRWEMTVQNEIVSWAVYCGPFTTHQEAQKRKTELANMGLDTEFIRNRPQYEPGLSFDIFRAEENAKRRLAEVTNKGVADAKIVPWTENPIGQLLRVNQATAQEQEKLNAMASQVGIPAFRSCPITPQLRETQSQ